MKKILIVLLLALLCGCDTVEVTTATIIEVQDVGAFQCYMKRQTLIETEAGFRQSICGELGDSGDKFTGYWVKPFNWKGRGYFRTI